MKIVLTGSAGRIGRAIYSTLMPLHQVIGVDRIPFATTALVGDITDKSVLQRACDGADAVIHTAGLHAPHVGYASDAEFERVNVHATSLLLDVGSRAGVSKIVFTSSTAVYGHAVRPNHCTWVDEQLRPEPESIYHRTKLAAEALLKQAATEKLKIRILRMSRCFPEAADRMAAYRLHRGIDARDVAKAHKLAVCDDGPVFACHLISGATPFEPEDCQELAIDAGAVIERRAPHLAQVFRERGWDLPASIDRVYSSRAFCVQFDWNAQHGYEEVLAQHDRESLEVLPVEESLTKLAST